MSLKGPRKWPHLASLCGGYLHQDFTAVHGSAPRAVQAWLTEARADDGAGTVVGVADVPQRHARDGSAGPRARTCASWPAAHGRLRDEREFETCRRC